MTPESNASNAAPAPNSLWRHAGGACYTVLMLTNEASEQPDRYPVTVVYRGEDGKTWSRPLSDWHRSMTLQA